LPDLPVSLIFFIPRKPSFPHPDTPLIWAGDTEKKFFDHHTYAAMIFFSFSFLFNKKGKENSQ